MLKMSTGSIEASPSPSPGSYNTSYTVPGGGVPKLGTLVPNRVFVGGISSSTTESELHQLFSEFGNVKQTKIIADRAGVSKGYGFVTFETEEEARRLQAASEDIVLKERKLNIAPAIKKQQTYGRSYEMGQPVINGAIYYHNGIPYTYQQNGVAMFVSDGQPCVGGGVISPTGKGSGLGTPFSLVYPGAPGTMFLPSQTQAAGVVSQQQLQFQAATAIREAVQSQTAVAGGTPTGSNHAAAWRWVNPQTTTTTPGPCSQSPGSNQSLSTQAGQQINQALSFTQDSGVWGPATTYPQQTQQSLTNTQPVFIPQTSVFTPTTPLYPSPTLGAQYPPVNMFTVPQQTLYPAQQQLMDQPFTQDGFSQESSSFPDSSSGQNTGDASIYQGLNQHSQLNYQPFYPQPIVVNPDGLMYMPYMYAQQNYVQPCKDLGGGVGSGVQELGVQDTQGTADGSVPAATNGQVTTTGQATTSGQTANEAGGNMFTQIKVPGDLKDGCQTCDNDKPYQSYLQNNQRRSEDAGSRFPNYYPENRFTFPTSGPLTPITPSVEPAPGSKTGYTVPQTPNTLTSKQFFHSNQSPGFHGLLTPDYTSSPHSYREKGELTLVKDLSTESSMIPPEQEKRSLFDSPFKRFTQFTGIPSMNRFPLQQVPTNRFQRRLPPSRIPYRPGTSRRGSSSQDKPLVSPRFLRQPPSRLSDNKVGFYQAGDRFGQKTQLEEGFKDDGKEDGGRIKSNCSSPILEKKVLDEPDLLQGQMQRLKL